MKLPKTYEPQQYEPEIYALWESANAFTPKGEGEPYSIIMPPPNANGNLHIGHALTIALEDILTRFHRMQGRDAVYIPGADHAGFETWVVYERLLEKQGKSRFDYSRDQLYGQVWDFVNEHRGGMELQVRALGASASWEHLVFTLDKKVIDTVYGTFKKLWDDGLIYRGERIVNYCTKHQTSFADIEVEHAVEKGKLWKIAYPLLDKIGEIIVATTRPETLLGDVAVAVHPEDPRYKDLIGTRVLLPLTNREIPIIADSAIDPNFGTGAVKITPAHDPTDFEIGERHYLEQRQVIGYDGLMTGDIPEQFNGLTVLEAREKVLDALEAAELRRGEIDHERSVGHCYKCGTIIQPLLKDQWFLKVTPLAARAKEAVANGDIAFIPESKGQALMQYYENIRDWNLSRQIPWGIPIPAFQNINDPDDWIFDPRVSEEKIIVDGKTYKREEDTFDTWFSSGQWPFITTDYLENGELSRFYPADMLETGHDILNSWISRMIMLGLYVTDKVPFKTVYLHGLVLDEHGQKMSKSKGNVVNPMEIISQYGSDALRLGIVSSRSAGQNQAFSPAKVVAARNFCNKLWNIARFIEDRVGDDYVNRGPKAMSIADHWVVQQLNSAATTIADHLKHHRFAEAAEVAYHTIWDDVADWYIEASKKQNNPSILAWVLETMLQLAHPFVPFVTETIWETLAWEKQLLINAPWPTPAAYDEIAAAAFTQLQKLVAEARFVAKELPGGKQTLLYGNDSLIADNADLIMHLARLKAVIRIDAPRGVRLAVPNREAWLDTTEEVLYEHQTKLEQRLAETRRMIAAMEGRLANEGYVKNAPERIVNETREQLEEQRRFAERLQQELDVL
ncbi:MAG TPA: valine--tRNA ligase [Verrucomicrobiae bacterium]|nr:valine--tRNA ligase [Verrucomicrobiae bacterium]